MKLNLPTTLTSQKISTLFLLTFLKTNQINAGQMFKDCLDNSFGSYYNTSDAYNSLINFPFDDYEGNLTNGNRLPICCDKENSPCHPEDGMCSGSIYSNFLCQKATQTIFCESWPQASCGGIIGDAPITSNYTFGTCPDFEIVVNNLTGVVPDDGYARGYCIGAKDCPNNGYLYCFWDNGGWSCDGLYYSNCYFQWPARLPLPINNNPKLAIIIPATVGGSVVIATATSCYLYRRKKNQQLSIVRILNARIISENPSETEIQTEVAKIINLWGSNEDLVREISKIIGEKDNQIKDLKREMEEKNERIRELKKRILEAYLYFAPEKDLLRELIKFQLVFSRLSKQNEPVVNQRELRENVYNKLKDRLEKEDMEEVEKVLRNCEDLVNSEYQLTQFEKKRKMNEIIVANINVSQGNVFWGNISIGNDADFSINNNQVETQIEIAGPPRFSR